MKPTTEQRSNERWRADSSNPGVGSRPAAGARVLLLLLRGYKLLFSPLFTGSCRFLPTCSDYMAEAVLRHGAARGVWLGICRLLRCHPFCTGGHDPVPERFGILIGLKRRVAIRDLEIQ